LLGLGYPVKVLDGDDMRRHLCQDLGFTREDRNENVRRIAEIAERLNQEGITVIVAAISPYREARDEARSRIGTFLEVWVRAPLEVCEKRDVKGLYREARAGKLPGLTGIDDPYEPPLSPEVVCDTEIETIEESASKIVAAALGAQPVHAPFNTESNRSDRDQ
jgi:adenylyl-sulfate kinase